MTQTIDIGSRRELFVDDVLIATLTGGAGQVLQHPVPREVALEMDRPWEGNMSGAYCTVFKDDGVYRMYYKGWQVELADPESKGESLHSPHPIFVCYAESPDGVHWTRPDVGLREFDGNTKNNIVLSPDLTDGVDQHGFAPFKDSNPACAPEMRYKGIGASGQYPGMAMYAFHSGDGIHWSLTSPEPIITKGKFDSQNLAFWDAARGEYRAYVRDFVDGCRAIAACTSPDFVHWTEPELLTYEDSPAEQLYTNQVTPYHRAPHMLLGFPARYIQRQWSDSFDVLPEREHRRRRTSVNERFGTALTEGLFMSSRDGQCFRRWREAFIRPGPQQTGNWTYGDNYQNWGLVETASAVGGAPDELSIYVSEHYWRNPGAVTRRYSLRLDGFVSVNSPMAGGELLTRPFSFAGDQLVLNVSTSAAGSVRVEVQDVEGDAIPGFALDDCVDIFGDAIDLPVRWTGDSDLGKLAGRPVRLRFVMQDADLFSMRFRQG